MAPLHLSLLPLLHPSTQHLRTHRGVRSHGAAKARKTNLPYDGEGALSVCTRVAWADELPLALRKGAAVSQVLAAEWAEAVV